MQFSSIGIEYKYDFSAPAFQTAFAFLGRKDLAALPEGWVDLEHGVRASVQHYTTMPQEDLNFETHEKFFDIQYLIEGIELIGACTRVGLREKTPYHADNDTTFYEDPAVSGAVLLRGGDFVVLAPEDAHKPRCIADDAMAVKKIVVKVPVKEVLA